MGGHDGKGGSHAGKPKPGNPGYGGYKQRGVNMGGQHRKGCGKALMVPILTILAGVILLLVMLTGCNKDKPDGVNPPPTPPAANDRHTPSLGTSAVCSATRNAYFKDALKSDVTGEAIFNLSNAEGVERHVKTAIHDMFKADGRLIAPDKLEASYEKVMSTCSATGWEPK